MLVGEPEKALDQLEPLLKIPVLPLARLAQDRPQLRSAAQEPATRIGPHGAGDGDGDVGLHVARAGTRPAVDHRSDIFSFGTILYEMLSGKRAFKRDTASDTIAAILKQDPPELTQSGRNVSPALDHIVRALHREGPGSAVSLRSRHRLRAFGSVVSDDRSTAACSVPPAPPTGGKSLASSSRRLSSFSAVAGVLLCDRRLGGAPRRRPAASSASPCCRSRTSALPRTTTSPTGSRTPCAASSPPCRASRSSRGAAPRPTRRRPRRRRRSPASSTPTTF